MSGRSGPIRFNEPAAEYRELAGEIDAAVRRVLTEDFYIRGRAVEEFEQEFAAFLGARHAVGVASGTDALHLALRAAGIGPGDEVITVPNSFTATAMAIVHAGARPVFVDIDPETFTLNPALLESALSGRTRAVLPVHLYGQPADMAEITAWAEGHGLAVIEDACQAHGAAYRGRKAGTLGRAAAFSFYPTKNLGGAGDSGMVVTDRPELAEKVRKLGNYGAAAKDRHEFLGWNSRLDSLQAAILKVKLGRLEKWNQRRREQAALYRELLRAGGAIGLPGVGAERTHVYHQFVIRVAASRRDWLRQRLAERGIPTLVHYPVPIHLQPAFSFLGLGPGSFPAAEAAAGEIISLPIQAHLGEEQIRQVAETLLQESQRAPGPGAGDSAPERV